MGRNCLHGRRRGRRGRQRGCCLQRPPLRGRAAGTAGDLVTEEFVITTTRLNSATFGKRSDAWVREGVGILFERKIGWSKRCWRVCGVLRSRGGTFVAYLTLLGLNS